MAILIILFGLLGLGWGLMGYRERDPRRKPVQGRYWWVLLPSFIYVLIPGGLGFTLTGIGVLIAVRPITDILILAGLVTIGIGLLWFLVTFVIGWNPDWLRPPRLRGPAGDN